MPLIIVGYRDDDCWSNWNTKVDVPLNVSARGLLSTTIQSCIAVSTSIPLPCAYQSATSQVEGVSKTFIIQLPHITTHQMNPCLPTVS